MRFANKRAPPCYIQGINVDTEIKKHGGLIISYTQNHKISEITPSTLIIDNDMHVVRAQKDRGIAFGKRLSFDNRIRGFEILLYWVSRHQKEIEKTHVIFGV